MITDITDKELDQFIYIESSRYSNRLVIRNYFNDIVNRCRISKWSNNAIKDLLEDLDK